MTIDGSYDIAKVAIDMPREILRLNAQLDLFWQQEHDLYRRLGLVDGMSVLDCGCGPAYLMEKLHGIYPSLQCSGIELSDPLFEAAKKTISEKSLDRCKVYKQSITSIDLPENSFDFIIMRIVLEHLPNPLDAIGETLRVLKPGGRLVIIDNDFDFHVRTSPPIPELDDLYKAYCEARVKDGGEPCIGRQLPELFSIAGFEQITFDIVSAHNLLTGDEAFSRSEGSGIALQLVHTGFLTNKCYDQLAINWSAMLRAPRHSIIRQLFVGSGQKPLKPGSSSQSKVADVKNPSERSSNQNISGKLYDHYTANTLVEGILFAVAEVLEKKPESIPSNRTLGDLGLDSVGSVLLSNRIEKELNIDMPSMDYFTDHSVDDIAAFIKEATIKNDYRSAMKEVENTMEFEEGEL